MAKQQSQRSWIIEHANQPSEAAIEAAVRRVLSWPRKGEAQQPLPTERTKLRFG